MKRLLGLSQRVAVAQGSGERRDCLAQDWRRFLDAVGVAWIALPNHPAAAIALAGELGVTGVVLTGGDDIGVFPERDATEAALIAWCGQRSRPLLGVCRGLQVLHHHFGGRLAAVAAETHVAKRHLVDFDDGGEREVNSYHNYSPAFENLPDNFPLRPLGRCRRDGAVEMAAGDGMRGIMWHPEREADFDPADISLVRLVFDLK